MTTDNNGEDIVQEEVTELQVAADQEVSKGVYSNLARVTFTKNEFILGFVLNVENEAHLVSRVIVSPEHMQHLSEAIQDSLEAHENEFGEQ